MVAKTLSILIIITTRVVSEIFTGKWWSQVSKDHYWYIDTFQWCANPNLDSDSRKKRWIQIQGALIRIRTSLMHSLWKSNNREQDINFWYLTIHFMASHVRKWHKVTFAVVFETKLSDGIIHNSRSANLKKRLIKEV